RGGGGVLGCLRRARLAGTASEACRGRPGGARHVRDALSTARSDAGNGVRQSRVRRVSPRHVRRPVDVGPFGYGLGARLARIEELGEAVVLWLQRAGLVVAEEHAPGRYPPELSQ